MKSIQLLLITAFCAFTCISWKPLDTNWICEKHKEFNVLYTSADKNNKDEYVMLVENGLFAVKKFFNTSYTKPFDIYIHPDRHSLDSTWQRDWNMPEFKSECWMVASGI